MKRIISIIALFALLLLFKSGFSQNQAKAAVPDKEKVLLRWNFNKGAELKEKIKAVVKLESLKVTSEHADFVREFGKDGLDAKGNLTLETELVEMVKAITSSGNFDLNTFLRKIKFDMEASSNHNEMKALKVALDTDTGKLSVENNGNSMVNDEKKPEDYRKIFDALRIDTLLSPTGKVLSIEIVPEKSKLENLRQFTGLSVRDLLECNIVCGFIGDMDLFTFPDTEIGVGQTWSREYSIRRFCPFLRYEFRRFDDEENENGNLDEAISKFPDSLKVSYKLESLKNGVARISATPGGEGEGFQKLITEQIPSFISTWAQIFGAECDISFTKNDIGTSSHVDFNTKEGRAKSAEFKTELDLALKVKFKERGQEITVNIELKGSIAVEGSME